MRFNLWGRSIKAVQKKYGRRFDLTVLTPKQIEQFERDFYLHIDAKDRQTGIMVPLSLNRTN